MPSTAATEIVQPLSRAMVPVCTPPGREASMGRVLLQQGDFSDRNFELFSCRWRQGTHTPKAVQYSAVYNDRPYRSQYIQMQGSTFDYTGTPHLTRPIAHSTLTCNSTFDCTGQTYLGIGRQHVLLGADLLLGKGVVPNQVPFIVHY